MVDKVMNIGSSKDVAAILGLSQSYIDKLRVYKPEESPPFIRVGKRAIYRLSGPDSLESWLAAKSVVGAPCGV